MSLDPLNHRILILRVRKINSLSKAKKAGSGSGAVPQAYRRLARCISQKDTKVVLSLGSGGIRMFAHLSVLRFLESIGARSHIAELWGSSGGAIVSLLYSMGLGAVELEKITQEYFSKKDVRFSPSIVSITKKILRDALLPRQGNGRLHGFHSIHRELQALIAQTQREQRKEQFPCYLLAYNLETNQTDVLTPGQVPDGPYADFIYETDPLDAIVASSSVPVLFVPKVVDDANGRRVYSDGGIGEEIPTLSVYKKWILDRETGLEKRKRLLVIAVDLGSELSSTGIFENWLLRRVPTLLMTAHVTDLVRRARIAEQKRVLTEDPNVELWEINFKLPQVGLLDTGAIPKVMESAERFLPEELARINDSLLG